MEVHARAPEPLSNRGPKDKNWQSWKQGFLIFMKASGGMKRSEDEKASFLMNLIGRVGQEALENITFDHPSEKDNMEILLRKFDEYFDPPKKEVEERYIFFTRSKRNNETIEDYINDLREKAKTCNFGTQSESLVRDMVIRDIKDKHLQKLIMAEKELNLNKIKDMYNAYQINTEKIRDVYKEKSTSEEGNKHKSGSNTRAAGPANPPPQVTFYKPCWRCGTKHPPKACPAWNSRCNSCNELHHLTHRCTKNEASNAAKSSTNDKVNKNLLSPFQQIKIKKNELKK